jgi:DNA modification methylase
VRHAAGAAEGGSHARHELREAERLGHVVVGAAREPAHLVVKNKTEGQKRTKDLVINKGDNKKKDGEYIVTPEYSRRSNIWKYGTGRPSDLNKILKETGLKHPAIFPEKLAKDHIVSWSNENDIVFDPFIGSGTVAKMAVLNKRKWLGFEMASEYIEISNKRLDNLEINN